MFPAIQLQASINSRLESVPRLILGITHHSAEAPAAPCCGWCGWLNIAFAPRIVGRFATRVAPGYARILGVDSSILGRKGSEQKEEQRLL